MNKINKVKRELDQKESVANIRVKDEEHAKGKMKILNELFDELSDSQKKIAVLTFPGKSCTVNEWWFGMTISEKKESFVKILTQINA